ncbi:MAG TPA: sigma-70 family RNA polymerase sigma factor [Opitutales bacterium]|jgi:RNA polymerase sigma factor (sigma-70 family)|nr:sigma-70 family RNA polymerase sigma factor [Opitutales bacterium]
MNPDADCLRRYAETQAEAAFAEVVRRHTDFVYSVALRVTLNDALAQEVTQMVFTQLARQAGALSKYDTIAGWLHTTARHCAINTIRGEERRRAREHEATLMQTIATTSEVHWEQLRPILDEAVGQLREDDRKAVLLRYFNNLSHQEVGAVLGLSEDTARKRVDRALEKLRGYFAQRGVKATAAILAAAISTNSVQAAPVGLAQKVVPASLAVAGSGHALLGAIFIMSNKTKIILALAVLLLISTGLYFAFAAPSEPKNVSILTNTSLQTKAAQVVTTPSSTAAPVPAPAPISPAPVTPPAVQEAAVATTASAPFQAVANAAPAAQLNVDTAMTDFASLLQAGDYAKAVETYMQIPATVSGQQLVDGLQKNPDFMKTVQMLINSTQSAQTVTPTYNDAGDLATYNLNSPTNGKTMVRWKKIKGLWFVDAFE